MKDKDELKRFELVTWERDRHGNPIKRVAVADDNPTTVGDFLENVEQINEARKPKKKGKTSE